MNNTLRLICTVLVSGTLVAGCSSSSTSPQVSPDETDSGMVDPGIVDPGTIDLNGDYTVDVSLSEAVAAVPECSEPVDGTLTVTNRTITGIVNVVLDVTGTINEDGSITGGFAIEDGSVVASYEGVVDGADLAGTWADIFGCSGSWRAMKAEI